MSRSFVICIKTLLRAGWSLVQQRWNLTLLWMISGLHKGNAVIFCYAHLLIMQISAEQHFMQPKSNNTSSLDSGRGSHSESCAGLCHSAGLLTHASHTFCLHVFSPLHHFPRQLMRDGHLFVVCLLCQAELITSSKCLLIKGENTTYGIWMHQLWSMLLCEVDNKVKKRKTKFSSGFDKLGVQSTMWCTRMLYVKRSQLIIQ